MLSRPTDPVKRGLLSVCESVLPCSLEISRVDTTLLSSYDDRRTSPELCLKACQSATTYRYPDMHG